VTATSGLSGLTVNSRLEREHIRLLQDRSINSSSRLSSDATKLKDSLDEITAQYQDIARSMAYHITTLDLPTAKGPIRLFDCEREHFRNSKSTPHTVHSSH
jgi:hypothetical protein